MEPNFCPLCKGELKKQTHRTYYCKGCKIVMQIIVEITSVESPLIDKEESYHDRNDN